ncbi:MAG TPA: hypothetical protein VI072_05405 [Polyangiaceae bacterium]
MQSPSELDPSPSSGAALPGDFSGPELAVSQGFVLELDRAVRRDLARLQGRIDDSTPRFSTAGGSPR